MKIRDFLKRRRLRLAAVFLLCAGLISACGGTVDTSFRLEQDGSGSRVMKVSASNEDVEKEVAGGAATLDQIAAEGLPLGMTFSGFQPEGDNLVATFTIPFSSPDDYLAKVSAALTASGRPVPTGPTVGVQDSVFLKGGWASEDFTSADLLGWLVDAVAERATSNLTSGDLLSIGTTEAAYGETPVSVGSAISFDTGQTAGITAIRSETSTADGATWQRKLILEMPEPEYAANSAAIDDYFADNAAAVETELDGSTRIFALTLEVGTPEELRAATDALLASEGSEFSVEITAGPGMGTSISVVDQVLCHGICGDPNLVASGKLKVPTTWELNGQPHSFEQAGVAEFQGRFEATFTEYPAITAVDAHLAVGLAGALTVQLEVTFGAVTDDQLKGITERFSPTAETATLTTEVVQGASVLHFDFSGADAFELEAAMQSVFPSARVTVASMGTRFSDDWLIDIDFGLDSLLGAATVSEQVNVTVGVPFMHQLDEFLAEPEMTFLGPVTAQEVTGLSLAISGPSLTALITGASLLIAALVMAAVMVVIGRKIAAVNRLHPRPAMHPQTSHTLELPTAAVQNPDHYWAPKSSSRETDQP